MSELNMQTNTDRSFISDEGQHKWEAHLAHVNSPDEHEAFEVHLASIHAEIKAERHQAFLEKKESYAGLFRVKENFILKGLFEPCEDAIFEKGILIKIKGKAYRLEDVIMISDISGGPSIGYLETDKVVWF